MPFSPENPMTVQDLISILSRYSPGQPIKLVTTRGSFTLHDVANSGINGTIWLLGVEE